jgi:polysaccharide pyruvyl transferase WcaK-like protein/sulfatase maturation enzyme AslB (radical SAM superfamily)
VNGPLEGVNASVVRKPTSLNFQVNDVCNARCVMCHVWTHKRTREMSPEEFRARLSDPYFSDLEHVGITGGEPTLRRDLAAYYTVAAETCPKLTGASFITHGFDTDRVMATYTRVAEDYRGRGLAFHGMVSIDGLGDVHDRVRGRSGAFEQATRTLFGLKGAGIPTSACCTIVRANVWGLWDLLEWGFDKTYIRFRVAEFINRLSNRDLTREIRAFQPAEISALIAFFETLIQSYEPDASVRRTYSSIIALLASGSRLVGCPYQDGRALNLDCRGDFAVCAPKGVPRPLGADPAAAVAAASDERRTIAATQCSGCIHDYHDEWTPDVSQQLARSTQITAQLLGERPASLGTSAPAAEGSQSRRVLVLGWYGTETIGDMAILNGLMDEYRAEDPSTSFVIPSQFPFYTRHNLTRLGLDALVTGYGDPELTGGLWDCSRVIIGGGPLMDIPQIASLAAIFERAHGLGLETVIESCGIGPVNLPATATGIARLAAAATTIRLRDAASADLLRALGITAAATVTSDPAARWVRSTGIRHSGTSDGPIRVFARALTSEYPQATSPSAAEHGVADFVRDLCDWFPGRTIELGAMHHFPIGGDDRVHARRLRARVARPNCVIDEVPRTPRETLERMAAASFVVCMRFHSLVFVHAIGTPFLAIDYTNGGKIAGFAADHGVASRVFRLDALAQLREDDVTALGAPRELVAQ